METDDSGTRSVAYLGPLGATGVLQEFDSLDVESDSPPGEDNKRRALRNAEELNDWLQAHGLPQTGEYEETTARANRKQYMDALDRNDPLYEGIIFGTE